jgi:hypothetical protein
MSTEEGLEVVDGTQGRLHHRAAHGHHLGDGGGRGCGRHQLHARRRGQPRLQQVQL